MMENQSFAVIRSPEDSVKQYQAYLRKYENDDKLVILEAIEEQGMKSGDHYLSLLIRLKLVGTRGDGSAYTKTFMTKKTVQDKKMSTFVDLSDLFRAEAYAYLKILPFFESFGPQCLYADKNAIIMEDLAEKGYVNCKRRNFLDLNHTIFVLKKLAKFHASTLTLKINNPQQFDTLCTPLEDVVYKSKSETTPIRLWIKTCMQSIIQHLDTIEPQTQELQTIKDHIVIHSDQIYDTIYRLFNGPKQKYDTICHGDPWINNLLFLYDKNGRIINLKMVDYQIIRHTSISSDIIYFIYSSVQSSLIEKSFESLIKIYHDEFLRELQQLRIQEKILKELGMEWLQKELQIFAYHGLVTGCFFINLILTEKEDVHQCETTELKLDKQVDMNLKMNDMKLDRMKCVVLHYYRRLHLGIINDDIEPISITE